VRQILIKLLFSIVRYKRNLNMIMSQYFRWGHRRGCIISRPRINVPQPSGSTKFRVVYNNMDQLFFIYIGRYFYVYFLLHSSFVYCHYGVVVCWFSFYLKKKILHKSLGKLLKWTLTKVYRYKYFFCTRYYIKLVKDWYAHLYVGLSVSTFKHLFYQFSSSDNKNSNN
jgi:hypothetical protein